MSFGKGGLPFQPKGMSREEFSALLKSYGITEIVSDRYAGEWVAEAFRLWRA
ncbi:MAG: hypothetical protein M0C28_02960 [Candidatus Moduliflexus flocculans]|nr:hypothetical protein [Candidatus Moduliflexus flocculans]